jgi:hypothetical protein
VSQIPESNKPMTGAAVDDRTLRELAGKAELHAAARHGVKRPFARAYLAREWGVSFWTLTNFRRGRLKDLRVATRDRIQLGVIRGIENEIQRLEHELVMARQCGAGLSNTKISQAAAALEQARAFLGATNGKT